MKKLHFFLFVATMACFVIACHKPVEVSFAPQSLTAEAAGGTYSVELKSNGNWTLELASEWLTVSPVSGNGDATLTVSVTPNTTYQTRSVEINATTKDNVAVLKVNQEAETIPVSSIILDPSAIECDQEGGIFEVVVKTQMTWSVSELPEWVACSVMEGVGMDTLQVSIRPLREGDHREAVVVLGNEESNAQLQINQTRVEEPEHHLSVSPTELEIVCSGESKRVTVVCDEFWSANYDYDWISLNQKEGEGDAEIELTVSANPLYEPRQCEIGFASVSGKTATLVVNQEATPDPHYLEVTPHNLVFVKEGGDLEVVVGCDTDWHVEFEAEWLSVSTEYGTGEGTLIFTAEPNIFDEARNTNVRVISGSLISTITVNQVPGDAHYSAVVTPDSLFVVRVGGVKSIAITSNCSWTITVPAWIAMPVTSGEGDATIEMMVSNNLYEPRTGIISIMHGTEVLATVVVVQDGIVGVLQTDVSEINMPAEGGIVYFHVIANQEWIIDNDTYWLSFDPEQGNGNQEVMLKAGPLEDSDMREARIVIKGSLHDMVTITVRQSR